MNYDKQTWQTGEVITANKLNHMEDGIEAAGGGYDLVFETNSDSVDESTEATLKSGSYADAAAKFLNGGYVTALVYGGSTRDENFYATTFNVQGVNYDSYTDGDPIIHTYFTFSDIIKRIDLESDGTVTVMQP